MDFQKILKQIAVENKTTPEDVYREMRIAIEDAFSHRNDSAETLALWKEMGIDKKCPTPEEFIRKTAGKLRMDLRKSEEGGRNEKNMFFS